MKDHRNPFLALLASVLLVVALVLVFVPSSSLAQEVASDMATAATMDPSWLANLSVWFGVLMTIALAASTAGYTVVEAVKAGWPWLATAEGPWPARVKRGIAVVVGIGSGLCGAAASPEVPWFLCLLAGAVGGGFPALVRGLAVAKRNGVAEAVEGCVRAKSELMRGRNGRGGTGTAAIVMLGLSVAGAAGFGMWSCSGVQVKQMRIAGSDALACLTHCGATEAVTTLKDWGDDGSVKLTWKDATNDMIQCATPCLWGLGVATFNTYAVGLPYFGSASEPDAYGGTMTEIVVSPRKTP